LNRICDYEYKKIPRKRIRKKNKKCGICESLIWKENILCRSCWKDKLKKSPKKRIPEKKNNCSCCNSPSYGKIFCKNCYNKNRLYKCERPKYEDLLLDIEENGYVKVAKKYGVSDNAIRKWIIKNIESKPIGELATLGKRLGR